MKNTKALIWLVIAIAVVSAVAVYVSPNSWADIEVPETQYEASRPDAEESTEDSETMTISVFIQDKQAAFDSDCSVTQKVTYEIPRTEGVADASLRILFSEELARYGTYESILVENETAFVTIRTDATTSGNLLESLSSCEIAHLQSVLGDTLTQYPAIKRIEILTQDGKVDF